jgi:UDP-N-acetylglucosamine diphosphorylase / glucose-1-phosphate thymidylyltransferase / UDP-N-acetylgalactosamine diphosphorylase / glucosamine-1-phosphate N-acetyltransferase / galactosamine-1-phosphate N-acetyltransferase
MQLKDYISAWPMDLSTEIKTMPWEITSEIPRMLPFVIKTLDEDYRIVNDVAIHRSATVEEHVILKGPIVIGPGCFIGAHAYLRGGVFLDGGVSIGPGCEIKTSIILSRSALAHFNFVGDSIIGANVNMEAGSVIANHYNEREDKFIHVVHDGLIIETGVTKFGALVGDHCRIGANAVLSPGTMLAPGTIVKRLELIQQSLT